MLSYLRAYYSLMPNFFAFTTPDEMGFLVFGVSNAKYLAFDTPDSDAFNILSLFLGRLEIYIYDKT